MTVSDSTSKVVSPTTKGRYDFDQFLPKIEKTDVSNKDVEKLLRGLVQAFENSSSDHYGVKRAKTTLTVTKSADGKLELGVGLGILKLVDAQGNVKGEWSTGIEIEIERKQDH